MNWAHQPRLFPSRLFKLKVYCRDGYWRPFKNALEFGQYKVADYSLADVLMLVQNTPEWQAVRPLPNPARFGFCE